MSSNCFNCKRLKPIAEFDGDSRDLVEGSTWYCVKPNVTAFWDEEDTSLIENMTHPCYAYEGKPSNSCFECKHLKDISELENKDDASFYASDSKWFCHPVGNPCTCWDGDEREAMLRGGLCNTFEVKEEEEEEEVIPHNLYEVFERVTEKYKGTFGVADASMVDDPDSSFIYQKMEKVPVLRKPVLPNGSYLVTIDGGNELYFRRKISINAYALINNGEGRSYRGLWDQKGYTVVAKIDPAGIHWVGKDE